MVLMNPTIPGLIQNHLCVSVYEGRKKLCRLDCLLPFSCTVIKYFLESGIGAVSVGVNWASAPPDVPKLFLWKEREVDRDGVVAMWNKGGYPANAGFTIQYPGGVSIDDAIISKTDNEL